MTYSLFWRSPALQFAQKQTPISVPAGGVVSNASSLVFTGKGAANYGKIQQENLLRLLESFAGPTAPANPTVGQVWYDTAGTLRVCVSTAPYGITWRSLNATQIGEVGDAPPANPVLGDSWFSRTGSASGVLYVYTGLGRYPAVEWNATAAGYYPPVSANTLGIQLNKQAFNGVTNYGECYISGYSAGVPADVNGTIQLAGVTTVIPKGALFTSRINSNGFIVYDTTGTLIVPSGSGPYFSVHELPDGRWQYDNNTYWTDFTPVTGMLAIGQITVDVQDTNAGPGVASATMWSAARQLSEMSQVPLIVAGGAIGGWNQVYPQIDVGAGRDEYEYVYNLVASLIGGALAFGGAGVIGRYIQDITGFSTLDASMQLAWQTLTPNDLNVLRGINALNELKVEPNSQDWDKLLAAAKWAVNRLELPVGIVDDISSLPFVTDGRPAPGALYSLPSSDVRYPSVDRRVNRRPGIVTTVRQYQETVNVLQAAYANRYLLKGMMAQPSQLSTVQQAAFTSTTPFSNGVVQHGLIYRFDFSKPDLERFFYSGQAIELVMQHTPSASPTTADTDLQNLVLNYGRIRVLAEHVLIMRRTPVELSMAPVERGSLIAPLQLVAGPIPVGAAVLSIFAGTTATGFQLHVDITAGGATTGTFKSTWNYISDDLTWTSSNGVERVYPAPLTYTGNDKQGSSVFV